MWKKLVDCGKTRAQTKIDMTAIIKDMAWVRIGRRMKFWYGVAVLVIKLWRYDRGFEICGKFWSGGGIVEVERRCKPWNDTTYPFFQYFRGCQYAFPLTRPDIIASRDRRQGERGCVKIHLLDTALKVRQIGYYDTPPEAQPIISKKRRKTKYIGLICCSFSYLTILKKNIHLVLLFTKKDN